MNVPGPGFPDTVLARAADIAVVSFDVDGVLTDGRIIYTESGDELKAFNVQDGAAVKLMQARGILVTLITGRSSGIVARRAAELGIEHVFQGAADKDAVLKGLLEKLRLPLEAAAHVGDDLPDIPLFDAVGLAIGVPNGHPAALGRTHYVTRLGGGEGVAREVCELLLRARKQWPYD